MTKAERTKRFILEKAAPIYNEKGLAGTLVDDILEATRLTKGSIYSHFENKEDLSIQVADYLLDNICYGIGQAMKKETSAKSKIFAYLDFNKTPLNTYISGGCPIFNLAVESDDNHGLIKSKVCNVLTASQKTFANILKAGIENGEFNASLDPEAYAFKMFAAIEGATVMCRNMNNDQPMAGLIESLKNELRAYEI
ncbi:TetR/AcrR family transcriptional regulator [Mucilaginibacter sp. McL0603]|uniref:TetR/AcrR family transcriptional regulator n=1 Tax=Mucilaginibacter sp. McL0603 TaxID=3415670 RepID=UPI003CE7F99D